MKVAFLLQKYFITQNIIHFGWVFLWFNNKRISGFPHRFRLDASRKETWLFDVCCCSYKVVVQMDSLLLIFTHPSFRTIATQNLPHDMKRKLCFLIRNVSPWHRTTVLWYKIAKMRKLSKKKRKWNWKETQKEAKKIDQRYGTDNTTWCTHTYNKTRSNFNLYVIIAIIKKVFANERTPRTPSLYFSTSFFPLLTPEFQIEMERTPYCTQYITISVSINCVMAQGNVHVCI